MKVRSLFALALAALLVPALASAAPPATKAAAPASPMQNLTVGGFVGYETDDIGGLALRFDGELPYRALTPQLNLSWVGSLGYSRLTEDVGGLDFAFNIVKAIPAARVTFPVNPQISVFGDAGLGFYYASFEVPSVDINFLTGEIRTTTETESEFGLMMRIGAGAWYQLNPQTRLGAMLEFDPYFGDVDATTFIIQAGAMFKL
jgi:hypothetical protein